MSCKAQSYRTFSFAPQIGNKLRSNHASRAREIRTGEELLLPVRPRYQPWESYCDLLFVRGAGRMRRHDSSGLT